MMNLTMIPSNFFGHIQYAQRGLVTIFFPLIALLINNLDFFFHIK
jgi:hypothetical protein